MSFSANSAPALGRLCGSRFLLLPSHQKPLTAEHAEEGRRVRGEVQTEPLPSLRDGVNGEPGAPGFFQLTLGPILSDQEGAGFDEGLVLRRERASEVAFDIEFGD